MGRVISHVGYLTLCKILVYQTRNIFINFWEKKNVKVLKRSFKIAESVNRRTDNTMDKGKRINNDLQNITHKTKDQATHTPLKSVGELRCSRRVSSFCSTCDTCRVTVKRHKHHPTWKSCWTPVYINKTWTPYKTDKSKDELHCF